MTGAQAREARRLLGWSADMLAAACDFPGGYMILEFERTNRLVRPKPGAPPINRHAVLACALEAAGIEITNDDIPKVKLRRSAK